MTSFDGGPPANAPGGGRMRLTVEGPVATLTFNQPPRRNAIDLRFVQDFASAALDIESNPSIRVILMRADGPIFSVGGDIEYMTNAGTHAQRHILEMAAMFHVAVERIRRSGAALVVALGGMAAGGGFSLVVGADLVVASKSAQLTSAYLKSGLTPDGGATWFLPRLVGRQQAFRILALNPVLSAEEALGMGLVTLVVDDDSLDAEACAIADVLADIPGEALSTLLHQLRASTHNGLADQLDLEASDIARLAGAPAAQSLLRAFLARSK